MIASLRSSPHCSIYGSALAILLAVSAPLISSPCLVAQNATTSLRGVVADPGGAVIPGAEVTLGNPATGLTRTAITAHQGEFQFLQIPPGSYRVTAAAPGFSLTTREGVVLLVDTPATLNLSLAVGAVSIDVEVSSGGALNSTDATLGNAFDSTQILSLPSEGRNPVELLSLQAGVSYLGTNADQASDSRSGAVNGARSDQTNITVDGLDDNDQLQGIAFTGALRMPMDSMEEFRVTTSNANADSGRSSGAQVSLVTKSGTNRLHGSAYEYNRTRFGVANDWFNKEAQISSGEPNKPGQLIRNTFGASLGGPIRHDRVFFFANYEGQRSREAVQQNQAVPTASLRAGTVKYLGQDGSPYSLSPANLQSIDQGCLASGSCPNGNGPNPAVLQLWNGNSKLPNGNAIPAYPLPNTPNSFGSDGGLNIAGYSFAAPQPQDLNTFLVKIDWNLTRDGSHRIFVRGNLQDDQTLSAAEFPGQPASQTTESNNKGIAAGYSAVFSPRLINNVRFAYIREGVNKSGFNNDSNVGFWNLSDPISFARSILVNVPVTQIADDMTQIKGSHTFQFGVNWRMVHNNRSSNEQNFFYGSTHPTWLLYGGIANTGQNLDPATSNAFAPVDSGFGYAYDAAVSDVTGILGSISAAYNQNKKGQFAAPGALIQRHFLSNESEAYAQDSWKAASNLQFTFGLRYTMLQPPYETGGNQVAPTPSLSSFFTRRTAAMQRGEVYRPAISFALAGQANGKDPYWNWDWRNASPRLAFAWSPSPSDGFWHAILGSGKTSIRGGYGLYFDHFGEGVVNSFDREGSFGLTTNLENPSGVESTNCVVRFTALTTIPGSNGCPVRANGPSVPELPGQPTGGFPSTPPGMGQNGGFAVAWGLDNTLKTPRASVIDLSIARELPAQFTLELAYTGRLGRHLLQEVDLAEPVNMSYAGSTYFQAATQLAKLANAKTPIGNVAPIAFWENLFPAAAGGGRFSCTDSNGNNTPCAPGPAPANPTATQNIYDLYFADNPNYTYALQSLDTECFPACSTLAPNGYAFWDDQFSSLYAWRSTGTSSYNGLQIMVRRHVAGVGFDINYTYSKSMDENSNAERINEYENGGGTALSYSGQAINSWAPKGLYGPSDFDTRQQLNANWVLDVPVGPGKRFGSGLPRVANLALAGWQVSGLTRWTSGFPFSISTYAFATDYEQDSRAVVVGAKPRTGVSVQNGVPNIFKAGPVAASGAFRFAYPGESGQRNNLVGPGYFGVDMSLAKQWTFARENGLRFAWDVFNVTNSVRFDDGTINQFLLYQQSLGNFSQTLTKPRVMQFSLRYSF